MKRFLICLFSFLFVGCSIAGGAVLLSNSSYSDNSGGGKSSPDENDVTQNAPTNSDLWTNGHYATAFDNEGEAGIDGSTEEKAYKIRTAEQLALLAYRINTSSTNSTYKSLYYVQTADIDLSAHYWDAIGTSSYYFSGAYDGGEYAISGLYTKSGSGSTYDYQGLFGYVRGQSKIDKAIIKNVGIIDSNIQGYQYVGGVVGYAYYSTVTNCYNTGTVTGSGGDVGGVVGYANSSTITNCYNTGVITGSGDRVGGVVGYAYSSTVTNCYNTGSVTGIEDVGGVVGDVYYNSTITNCYNTGNITGSGSRVGGVAGYALSSARVTNCYNTGAIDGYSSVGGVVGYAYDSQITNCYNTGSVSGSYEYVGGVVGLANNPDITNNYYGGNCTLSYGIGSSSSNTGASKDENLIANAKSLSWYEDSSKWDDKYSWDFENVWQIDSNINNGYPYLTNSFGDMFPNDIEHYWTNEGNYADSFAGGSGTESDPYKIATPKQLARLAYLINSSSTNSTYKSLYYVQTANLDMSEYWWESIGYSSSYYFSGHYDGGGYTISGLYTENGYSNQGLFGYVRGQSSSTKATIKNVGIIDSNIQGYEYVGGVVGEAYYSTITNCYNTGNVTGSDRFVGGVVGYAYYSTITNCYNTGKVTGGNWVGGVAGDVRKDSTITNCYNTGTVTGGGSDVGGVAGDVREDSTITNCYNTGTVTGSGGDVGGVVGSGNAANCYNTGNVTGSGNFVGGVAGSGNAANCYNTGNVTGSGNFVGGVVGNYHDRVINCYNTGKVTGDNWVGGVVGEAYYSSTTITNCYNTGKVTGDNRVGGVVGEGSAVNCYNTGSVTGSYYVGGIVGYAGYSTITNNYYGGNCTLSYGIGDSSSNTGASKDENLIANAKSLSWYQDSSKWSSRYPWDFVEVWSLVPSANDGYPILQGFSVNITYNSNYGENEVITEQVPSGQEIVIAGYDLFTRVGYEIAHWNTKPDGTGLNFYAGDTYSEGAGLTLYAIWEAGIYTVTLDANGGSGGTQEIWVKYGNGFYVNSSATGSPITSLTSLPTREGYTFNGFYTSATSGTRLIDSTGKIVASNTFTTADFILYAQWVANNPAKYDSEGGYWYIENGKMPQDKVTDSTLISNINSSITVGTTYYFAGLSLQSKVYNGKEYCQYNNSWYEVMPIKWRLVYSSSQTSGYGTTTDTLAVLAEIVYIDAFSDSFLGANAGYSSESVTEFKQNQIDGTYLLSETKSMPTFGSTSINGTLTSVTENIFVASSENISNFTTNASGTEKLGSIKFSDLAKDFLLTNGKDTLYFTSDLGTNYNNLWCMNANGDRVQYKTNNYLGIQFSIVVTEYACV